ncbi:MAG: hypothetical protein NT077_00760, partial [Candidatus Taylorbacteria bacterium]|nr:hypothetical protein [Candidatus Taylorbacteria bacterium]
GTDGSMGISYGNLVAVAFQAIKELNQKVTDLQSQMKNFVFDKLTAKIAYVDEANIKKLTVTDTSFEGRVMFNDKSSLCVDNVCLTKDQLKQMILERGATTYGSAADQMKGINPLDVPTTPVVDTTPVTTTATTTPVETATSTAPVVSTTPIVETIVATTTPIITPTPVEATTTPITISVPETPVVTPTSASTTETTI